MRKLVPFPSAAHALLTGLIALVSSSSPASAQETDKLESPSVTPAKGEPTPNPQLPAAAPPNVQTTESELGPRELGAPVPSLSVLLERVRTRAPQIRLGHAALDVSRTGLINARRAPLANPYFEFLGQHGMNGVTQGVSWTGQMWLPFELFGQRGGRIAEAEAYQDIFEANLDWAAAAALGEAYATYGATLVAAARVRVLEQIVAVSRKTADMYAARLEAGDAVLRDATLAKVDLARNQVLLREAQGRLGALLADLSRVAGDDYDHVKNDPLSPPPVEFDNYLAKVREGLPPVVATAEAEAKYYESQRQRLKNETLGPVTLMLMGGRGDFGEARLGAGLAYEMPVFRSAQGDKARAEQEQLRAKTESSVARRNIERRVDGITEQYRFGQNAYDLLDNVALPAASAAVASAQETVESGKADWFVVLVSRRDQAMLVLERLSVIERQWSLLGELIQLTGELP